MAKFHNQIRLSSANDHLLDIFYDVHYLELGTISLDEFKKLQSKKFLNIREFVNLKVQNIGIGASSISDENLKNNLPYIFLDNVKAKNPEVQTFLTYGVIGYKDDQNLEKFAPIILIPVNIYFFDSNVYIRVDEKPFENKVLFNYLQKRFSIKISSLDKADNIYQLDRFCQQFNKYDFLKTSPENYLTIANIAKPAILINHEKFSLQNQFAYGLNNKYYLNEETEIYNISLINNRQRLAVQRAKYGNSFIISGHIGTGKTTTLINIAADAIYRNKKVLYISNKKESVKAVYESFRARGLEFLVTNLLAPLSLSLPKRNEPITEDVVDEIRDHLLENYEIIDEYEKLLSTRILNFRFLDVLKNAFLLEKPQEDFDIDYLGDLYKHEFEEVLESLKVIESKNKLLDQPFKKSKFNNIPINHQIKYPNQITMLLFQIHKGFTDLLNKSNILESDYGFKKIPNYARFKNVITDFNNLYIKKVPDSWKKDEKLFLQANESFKEFKATIYSIQEYELFLDWDYENLDEIDIKEEIKKLLGKYYTEENIKEINRLITNQPNISSRLQLGYHYSKQYLDVKEKTKEILDWNFSDNDNKAISEVVRLIKYLNENFVYKKWLNIKNFKKNRERIIILREKIHDYNRLEKLYLKYYKSIETLNSNITRLTNYLEKGKAPKRYKDVNISTLIDSFKELKALKKDISKLKKDYFELTGQEFNPKYDILNDYDNCYNYIKSIENADFRMEITKFISNLDYNKLGDYLETLNKFRDSYLITKRAYRYIQRFFPMINASNHYEKVNFIQEAFNYMDGIKEATDKMRYVYKKDHEFIEFEKFLLLRDRQKSLEKFKKAIRENQDYPVLYEGLFNYEKTNVNEIGILLQHFEVYINCYQNYDAVQNSFKAETYDEIKNHLEGVSRTIYEINESFKLYAKIFKDGVGNFYYDSFADIIEFVDDLMKSKEELINYLEITEHLKTILKYRLYILNNLVINNETPNIVSIFKHHYFKTVYGMFVKKYPEVLDTDRVEKALLASMVLEKKVTEHHIQELRKKRPARTPTSRGEFIEDSTKKLSKPLLLASTTIANHHLSLKDFDLILIDDAHIGHANEYYKVIKGKQVVIAGEHLVSSTASANLISRMRPANIMNLNYRYLPTPLHLLGKTENLHGAFSPNVSDRAGIEIITYDEADIISRLFIKDNNIRINYFTPEISKKRKLLEKITQTLIDNDVDIKEIERILLRRLNIADVFSSYAISADYNIINIADYKYYFYQMKTNSISNLLLCTKKLYIIDNDEILNKDREAPFVKEMQKILTDEVNNFNYNIDPLLIKIKNKLEESNIVVHGSYRDLSLIIEYKGAYYGILVYINPYTSHIDLLEDYRDYVEIFRINKMKIFTIWIVDLFNDFDKVTSNIVKEIEL